MSEMRCVREKTVSRLVACTLFLSLQIIAADCCCIHKWQLHGAAFEMQCQGSYEAESRRSELARNIILFVNMTTASEQATYVAAKSSLFYFFSSDLWDALTFGILSVAGRSAALSVCSSSLTRNEGAFAESGHLLVNHGYRFVQRLDGQNSQETDYTGGRSGVLIFLPLCLISIFFVFVILPLVQNSAPARMLKVLASKDGINSASVILAMSYTSVWIYKAARFYTDPTDKWRLVTQNGGIFFTPFTVNLVFLSFTLAVSFTCTMCLNKLRTPNYSFGKEKCAYGIIEVTGASSWAVLGACMIYHTPFLIISLCLEWSTALSNMTTWVAIILMTFTACSAVAHQLKRTLNTGRRFLQLVLVLMLASTIPALYYACVTGFIGLLRVDTSDGVTAPLLVTVLWFSVVMVACQGVVYSIVVSHSYQDQKNVKPVSKKNDLVAVI